MLERFIDSVCLWLLTRSGRRGRLGLSSPCTPPVNTLNGGKEDVGTELSLAGRQELLVKALGTTHSAFFWVALEPGEPGLSPKAVSSIRVQLEDWLTQSTLSECATAQVISLPYS